MCFMTTTGKFYLKFVKNNTKPPLTTLFHPPAAKRNDLLPSMTRTKCGGGPVVFHNEDNGNNAINRNHLEEPSSNDFVTACVTNDDLHDDSGEDSGEDTDDDSDDDLIIPPVKKWHFNGIDYTVEQDYRNARKEFGRSIFSGIVQAKAALVDGDKKKKVRAVKYISI